MAYRATEPHYRLNTRLQPRLQVLYLTCHLPFPPHSGGRLRDAELIRHLAEQVDIHLCVVSKTYELDSTHLSEAQRYCRSVSMLAAEPIENGEVSDKVRRHRCPDMISLMATLRRTVAIDLIHVEGYYLMQHVPVGVTVPVFLGTQNIEYLLDEQRSALSLPGADVLPESARRAEETAWSRADGYGAVSHDDLIHLRHHTGVPGTWWTPNGSDHLSGEDAEHPLPELGDRLSVLYLANFGYQPSSDAARLLCERIWPFVHAQVPHAQLILVGANPPDWLWTYAARDPSVTVTGPVASVSPWLRRSDVVLAPLRIGGGVKVKILEAITAGCAVVTTPVGVQGLPSEVRDAMVVVSTDGDAARSTIALLQSPERRRSLRTAARRAARLLPTWSRAACLLHDAWLATLAQARVHRDGHERAE